MAPRPPWRWIVPLGALAAGVIVWIGVRGIQTQRHQAMESVQVAQNRQAIPQAPASDYQDTFQLKKEELPPEKLDEVTRAQKAPVSTPPKFASSPQAAKESAPPPSANEVAADNKVNAGISGARVALPPPTSPVPSGAARGGTMRIAVPPSIGATAPEGTAGNRPAEAKKQAVVPSVAESVEVTAAAPVADATSSSSLNSTSTQLTMNARKVASLLQLAAGDPRYILAPGEKHAWRVGAAGKIERSTDGGKSWKPQKSGVPADLTAGSATSDKICWLIGKAGTVLLTTDGGKHWKQIPSPITEDLGGIHATDVQHASLWDVSNRKSFETTDGGATWNRTSKD